MAWDEERIEEFKRHILQPNDTFTFSCDMCGNCCRNRDEPILMTGADIFRIAKGLGISTLEVLFKHTRGYIGDTTHLPLQYSKSDLMEAVASLERVSVQSKHLNLHHALCTHWGVCMMNGIRSSIILISPIHVAKAENLVGYGHSKSGLMNFILRTTWTM